MPDFFDEAERELAAKGGGTSLVTTKPTKRDAFAIMEEQLNAPYSQMEAFRKGAVSDLPVIGPLAEHGYQAGKAALGYDPGFTERAAAANPDYANLGGLISNTAVMGPIGATRYGGMAIGARGLPVLGQLGENLGVRMGVGAASGGTLGAADAYMRGESPVAGGALGVVAGGAAPALGGVIRGLVSPFNAPQTIAQRAGQPAVDTLTGEGVRLSAGGVTGSKGLQGFEDILRHYPGVGGRAEDVLKRPHVDFTTAALRRVNPNLPEGTLATPEVLTRERAALQNGLNAVRNQTVLYPGQDFANDLQTARAAYDRVQALGAQRDPNVIRLFDEMERRLQQGSVPGDVYQQMRTDLRQLGEGALGQGKTRTPTSDAYFAMRRALDAQMERNVPPQLAEQWHDLNRRYGNYKTIEDAMTSGGQEANKGFLSPSALGAAVRSRGGNAYARNAGPELTDLARAGSAVLRPLPESGTGRQAIAAGLMTTIGAGAGGALGFRSDEDNPARAGLTGGALGGGAGFLGALLAGRAALSPTGQRILANQLLSTPRAVSLALGPLQQLSLPGRSPTLRDLGE